MGFIDPADASLRAVHPNGPLNLWLENEMTKAEAKEKANETARSGKVSEQDSVAANVPLVEIVDRAMPGSKPIRPNVPLNLFVGAAIGIFTALLVGGVAALLVGKSLRKNVLALVSAMMFLPVMVNVAAGYALSAGHLFQEVANQDSARWRRHSHRPFYPAIHSGDI